MASNALMRWLETLCGKAALIKALEEQTAEVRRLNALVSHMTSSLNKAKQDLETLATMKGNMVTSALKTSAGECTKSIDRALEGSRVNTFLNALKATTPSKK